MDGASATGAGGSALQTSQVGSGQAAGIVDGNTDEEQKKIERDLLIKH
jgi:hypothetical protein